MTEEKNILQQQEMTPAQRIKSDWKALLDKISYKGIVNNIPFLAFVVLLMLIYISNSQRAIETQREINKQEKLLKELNWKYMNVKSNLTKAGLESEVMRNAASIGLKPMLLPAYKIEEDSSKKLLP